MLYCLKDPSPEPLSCKTYYHVKDPSRLCCQRCGFLVKIGDLVTKIHTPKGLVFEHTQCPKNGEKTHPRPIFVIVIDGLRNQFFKENFKGLYGQPVLKSTPEPENILKWRELTVKNYW